MPDDISLLPEEIRKKEEELKSHTPPPTTGGDVKMHLPHPEQDDVEIIEVDEGEVGEVLKGESFVAKTLFKAQSLAGDLKSKLFEPHAAEPPPKLPPQFFTPPSGKKGPPGLIPTNGGTAAAVQPPKARVMPAAQAPRRVRVIRRVRKPVHVSFIEQADARSHIDLGRRLFTLILLFIVFSALAGGGYVLLRRQGDRANANVREATGRLQEAQQATKERLANWESFRDLEPRLKALSQLLDRHVSPSRLFDALEAHTVPDVFYSTFTLSPDGRLLLGTTAPSFESAARQLVALQSSGIARSVEAMGYQARYNGTTGKLESVTFQIALTIDPRALLAQAPPTSR
jgi:hypothetical protein